MVNPLHAWSSSFTTILKKVPFQAKPPCIAHFADTVFVSNSIVSDGYYGLVWGQTAPTSP